MTLPLKPGTVLVAAPTVGVPSSECVVCTGPHAVREFAKEQTLEAFVTGMAAGVKILVEKKRLPLCIDHEMMFRESLALLDVARPETLDALGIEYTVVPDESPS